jgi:hypothetical protein
MSVSLKKLWNNYGVGGVLIAIIILYGLYMLYKNLMSKGSSGNEMMSQDRKKAYNNSSPLLRCWCYFFWICNGGNTNGNCPRSFQPQTVYHIETPRKHE